MQKHFLSFFCVLALLTASTNALFAFSGGPDDQRTGAPGEGTCNDSGCHAGNTINATGGSVEIIGLPANYALNTVYPLTVRVSHTTAMRWGFELAAKTAGNAQAGTITVTDPTNTQSSSGTGVTYIKHTVTGTKAGTATSSSWTFSWTSPSTNVGAVTLYAAGNAANNNNNNTGDFIYTTNASAAAPAAQDDGPYNFVLSVTGFTPHMNQTLRMRVTDRNDGSEVARSSFTVTSAAMDFTLTDVLVKSHSYNVDFFSDHNGNGLYDAPSTDHAWRIIVNDAQADVTQTFAHNTTFTDIAWPYAARVNFTGMTPHVNQTIWARLVEIGSGREMSRDSLVAPGAAYSITLPGVKIGGDYYIDFYADHNGNGRYDAPSTDHAWRLTYADATGDSSFAFAHNTSFTDIAWKYAAVITFTGMTPHVGQTIRFRAVDSATGMETGRTSVSVLQAAFQVQVPGLTFGGSYNIDFFADHNGNGRYDAPSTDHAWRQTVANVQGDAAIAFAHNTTFTDITWPYDATVVFTNMTPHVGQTFNIRLNRPGTPVTIVAARSFTVPSANFDVVLPGLLPSTSYNIDFYADHNGNGSYDAPSTDHAWRLPLASGLADTSLSFVHNTTFTDIQWDVSTGIDDVADDQAVPSEFRLSQNYPNPFNPSTIIGFTLPQQAQVELTIFNALGRKVRTLVNSGIGAGAHTVTWDGRDDHGMQVASGLYIYTIHAGTKMESRKMLLMK